MRRRLAAAAAVLALALVAGCGTGDDWDPDAQFAPSLRPAFGARMDGTDLRIWTGSPCVDVTRLALVFDLGTSDSTETVWSSEQGATVERFTVGEAPEGLAVQTALPGGFDWSTATTLSLVVSGPPATWGSRVELEEVREASSDHDDDTYFFQGVGWLDPEQVTAGDGQDFLTTCTPDPASR